MISAALIALTWCPAPQWVPLFNGRNLDGWSAKIAGHELGDNFGNTFRVPMDPRFKAHRGIHLLPVIQVNYDAYGGKFENRFGHLFYKSLFRTYIFRCEYRFTGEQLADAPGWAYRNSGIMFHCQDPKTMGKDQPFPVCIEYQLLGAPPRPSGGEGGSNKGLSSGESDLEGGEGQARHTGNVCTPGTNIVYQGKLWTQHCTDSTSKTYHGDLWVKAELEVQPGGHVIHRINGETVLEYDQPQLDPNDGYAKPLFEAAKGELKLDRGWIALQSESTPCEFRKIEILEMR